MLWVIEKQNAMLSQKLKYSLRAVLYLSLRETSDDPVGALEISRALKIPAAYTGKILQELARNEIISSQKGPNGGFYLTKANRSARIIRVVEIVDGVSMFHSCGLGLSQCSETRPCPFHDTFKSIRTSLLAVFRSKTIGELSQDILNHDLFLVR